MKKLITFYIGLILGITLISCNKDKDPIVVQPTAPVNEFTQIYVLDSIAQPNNGYADTIYVSTDNLKTSSPHIHGNTWDGIIETTYNAFGDYYAIVDELLNDGNPNSTINGHYRFRGDTLDYVYRTNAIIMQDYRAFYIKVQ